ncbi:MAG: putative manganese-dependent inorganic diphosphatase [Mogibacterium sp.]|nr:putative manganese-dependent inorganic diphosphatase [Mogibacterium sp.]
MSIVYITGHRNPDLDSLCAAISYSRLKNMTDPENEYVPVHCSPVSDGVRKQMEAMGLEIPVYKKDVRPKVKDVMMVPSSHLQIHQPIFDLVQFYSTENPPVVPLFAGEEFKGLLSVDDITGWFLKDNKETVPVYQFSADNVIRVISGKQIHKGTNEEIEGSLLVGAAAYDAFCNFIEEYPQCIVVMGYRKEHMEYAVKMQVPAIVLTAGDLEAGAPDIDLSGYNGSVFLTELGTAETIRRIRMAEPLETMMEIGTETADAEDLFVDVKATLANSRTRGIAVMENGEFAGYVSRRCFLDAPKNKVIMVDHNEPAQSIEGIETADVIEIIDHHRLDSVSTSMPIFIDAEPLGSTCTIIYQQYIRHGIMPDPYMAKVMLTGIISDTLILRSPTTTASDISTVEMLARLARVSSIEEFGEKLFSITDNLETQDPEESILADFKKYESGGVKMGVGQCEVTTLGNVSTYAQRYIDTLEAIRNKEGLDWTLLMITDVLREKSVLLVSDHKANKELPYAQKAKQIYNMPGVMSRKKQLLPTLISITAK